MKDKIFLVMNKRNVVKMTKTPPAIKPNERTFVINILIPDKVFETQQFIGKMEIKETEMEIIDKLEFELNILKEWGREPK